MSRVPAIPCCSPPSSPSSTRSPSGRTPSARSACCRGRSLRRAGSRRRWRRCSAPGCASRSSTSAPSPSTATPASGSRSHDRSATGSGATSPAWPGSAVSRRTRGRSTSGCAGHERPRHAPGTSSARPLGSPAGSSSGCPFVNRWPIWLRYAPDATRLSSAVHPGMNRPWRSPERGRRARDLVVGGPSPQVGDLLVEEDVHVVAPAERGESRISDGAVVAVHERRIPQHHAAVGPRQQRAPGTTGQALDHGSAGAARRADHALHRVIDASGARRQRDRRPGTGVVDPAGQPRNDLGPILVRARCCEVLRLEQLEPVDAMASPHEGEALLLEPAGDGRVRVSEPADTVPLSPLQRHRAPGEDRHDVEWLRTLDQRSTRERGVVQVWRHDQDRPGRRERHMHPCSREPVVAA